MNSADFFDQKAIRKEQTQDEQHRRIDEKLRASKSHWWSRRDYSQLTAEERDLIKNRDQYSSRRDAWHFGVIQAGNARYTVKEDRQKTRTERQETKRRIETKKLNQAIDNMPDAEKERYLEYWSTRDPEAMKEYQAFMAKKNKNSGNAAAAASENATDRANGDAAVAAVALMATGDSENEAGAETTTADGATEESAVSMEQTVPSANVQVSSPDVHTQAGGNNMQSQTMEQLEKSKKSYERLIEEHEQKLKDYIADPDAHDNQGRLANATPEVREKIISGRVKALEKQIAKQKRELEKLVKMIDERSGGNDEGE